jgi:hypothetical protein
MKKNEQEGADLRSAEDREGEIKVLSKEEKFYKKLEELEAVGWEKRGDYECGCGNYGDYWKGSNEEGPLQACSNCLTIN